MVILNTTYDNQNTPKEIRDWMDLIRESMKNPANPKINNSKMTIAKAALLADFKNISPEQLADAKIQEMRKEAAEKLRADGKEDGMEEVRAEEKIKKDNRIKKALQQGKFSKADIAKLFEETIEYIEELEKEKRND